MTRASVQGNVGLGCGLHCRLAASGALFQVPCGAHEASLAVAAVRQSKGWLLWGRMEAGLWCAENKLQGNKPCRTQ